MSSNSFGKLFTISTFGESHGVGVGVLIDGCPSNLEVDMELIKTDLARRRPGQSEISSPRNELEALEILSGVFQGKTTGAPITVFVKNKDHRTADYEEIKNIYRPSHADYVYDKKYGNRDYRGGGRSSARETLARVIAGAFAKMILRKLGVAITAYVSQVGILKMAELYKLPDNYREANIVRCPDPELAEEMIEQIASARDAGDTLGGRVSCIVTGVKVGIGAPIYNKLSANLAQAMMSINASKGFEIGSGFDAIEMRGSVHNDAFGLDDQGVIITSSNRSGGIQAGISNGMPITFSVAFKPVSTLRLEQSTVDSSGALQNIKTEGRHDPCVVPRAVPIVEAMAALVLVDQYMLASAQGLIETE